MDGAAGDELQSANCDNDKIQLPDSIDIRLIDNKMGHGIFAKKKFNQGETIFKDEPIITAQFAWNSLYRYRACEYCMRALETAEENARRLVGRNTVEIPYQELCETKREEHVNCSHCGVFYCSQNCLDIAWKEYHSILCLRVRTLPENHPMVILDTYWRGKHYPPEECSIMLLLKLLVKLHLDTDGTLRKRLEKFCSSTVSMNEELVHKMLGENFQGQIAKLRDLVANVISFDNVKDWMTPEGFLRLFVLVARNGQGVGTSSFAIWVNNLEKSLDITDEEKSKYLNRIDQIYCDMHQNVGHFLDNEGSALYPIQSWVNHSCIPNCEVQFPERNHITSIVSVRDIEEGEEITISYLDTEYLDRSRYSRRKYLKEHYLFSCECDRCMAQMDEEERTSSEEDDEDEMDNDNSGNEAEMVSETL